jgi:hypothetical protein
MSTNHQNPYAGFTYQLFIGGVPQAGFSQAQMQAGTINFAHGLSTSLAFHEWLHNSLPAKSIPQTIEMTIYAEDGEEVSTWQIEECLPARVRTSEAAIELLSCKHAGFTQLS